MEENNIEKNTETPVESNVANTNENKVVSGKMPNYVKTLIIIVAIFIIVIFAGGVYYGFMENPDNTPTPTPMPTSKPDNVLTDDEAIALAKEKLTDANSLFQDRCENDDSYLVNGEKTNYCYYDTLENFNNKFYSIYSKQLQYEDVYGKFDGSESYISPKDYMFSYVEKDNKVYHDSCTIGGDSFDGMDNFVVNSNTSDKLEISYKINYTVEPDKYTQDATITLVKEDGSWKILSASVIQMCNHFVEVGK